LTHASSLTPLHLSLSLSRLTCFRFLLFFSFSHVLQHVQSMGVNVESSSRRNRAYFQQSWNCFDAFMVFCLWASIVLQCFELRATWRTGEEEQKFWRQYGWLSVLRCPRPLILIRVFRAVLKLRLPPARVNAIFQRSTHQIYNVSVFLLFFMSLYGLLGVQFFGDELNYHCVVKSANESNLLKSDLAIPDSYCNPFAPETESQCPKNMKCVRARTSIADEGSYASFEAFHISMFTVYQASSQEGWVFIMYRAMDCLAPWKGVAYFITMIFMLAWLVKNVFIAVLTETFAEIRVQFQQMWSPRIATDTDFSKALVHRFAIFQFDGTSWKLVPVHERKSRGLAPRFVEETLLKSTGFNIVIMLLVLANAITAAGQHFNHQRVRHDDYDGQIHMDGFYFAELAFTMVFNLEAAFKIWCLGWRTYWSRSLFKFELMLCIGTTLHCIPQLYRTEFTYLAVMRIVRLIKASPMLEDFCFKIFGPGKKLGSLVLFTTCLLVITSTFSLQLFCFFQAFDEEFDRFETFPKAFMSMFQILTQKGWVAVMHDTMDVVDSAAVTTGVAIYFVFYHLFVTLIVLSLFVAVILDNLELDEDIKKLKQLKMREISAETQQKLPLRLRIFEKFPNRPQMVKLTRLVSDFLLPKIRDSFMRQFAAVSALEEVEEEAVSEILAAATTMASISASAALIHSGLSSASATAGVAGASGGGGGGGTGPATKPIIPQSHSVSGTSGACDSGVPNSAAGGWRSKAAETAAAISCSREIRRKVHGLHGEEKVRAIVYLLNESNKTRMLSMEQPPNANGRSLLSTQHHIRLERRSLRNRSGGSLGTTFLGRDGTPMGMSMGIGIRGGIGSGGLGGLNIVSGLGGSDSAADSRTALDNTGHYDIKVLQQKAQMAEIKRTQQEEELRENHPLFDRPLFTLGRQSRLRRFCSLVVRARHKASRSSSGNDSNGGSIHKILGFVTYLDWSMLTITILSCISMSLETPHRRLMNTPELKIGEYIFFVGMTIELALKVLADGFIFTPNALLRDFGGFLDIFTYIVSLTFVSHFMRVEKLGPGSVGQLFMVLRCLRPLRIFCLVPQMRRVVYELVRGFREILMVTVLLVVFIFIFAVYGVHMFGGRLAICNDRTITRKEDCKGVFRRELSVTRMKSFKGPAPKFLVPRVWANPRNFNFDNIGNAILALFEVLSLEGWVEIRDVIRARIGPTHVVYIHLFVFVGCLIGLTLFVGVVIANYSENKGTALLTVDQRRWLDLKGRIKLTQPLHIPPRPKLRPEPGQLPISSETTFLRFRCLIYDITQHIAFKRAFALLVLFNSALLFFPFNERGAEAFPWVRIRYRVQVTLAMIFTFLFCTECVMKIIALTFNGYWQSKRNRFDLFVSILGLIWIVLHFSLRSTPGNRIISNNSGWVIQMLRFFTIAGKYVTLKMLMLTVTMSIYKSLFILTSMVVLMLVYGLMGVVLFGSVKFGDNLGRHANFHNAFRAIILLSRIVTGEDWNKIMHDCMIQPPFCIVKETFWGTNCGNAQASLAYFCSFYVIITYVMLNVLVAIIMENFSLFYSNDEDAIMSYNDIRNFQQAWNIIDVNRKGMVKAYYVRFLLRLIPRERVGFDLSKKRDKQLFKEMCYEVETLRGGRDKEVSFHDVLMVLAYRTVDITKTLQLEELIAREDLEYAIEEEVARQTIATWIERCIFRKRQKHGHLHFSMHSGSDRPTSGQSFEDTNKETPTAANKSDFAKSSIRTRPSKIKFSRDELNARMESVDNPPSASSTNQSPPTTPTLQPILSPVANTIRATDTAVARMASFQDTCELRGRVNGRLDPKSLKSDTHIPDGLLSNSISNKAGGSSLLPPPTSPSLTFVDSCTKSKQAPPNAVNTNLSETELHKGFRLTGSSGNFFRRRSMRASKTHTSLFSGVVEDSDQVPRLSLFSGTGMPAIQEAGAGLTKNSSIELNELNTTSPSLSIPTGDKQYLDSAASSLSEQVGEVVEKSGQNESSRISPSCEKRSAMKSLTDENPGILVLTQNVQTSCQDVKSWWMQQIHPEIPPANKTSTRDSLEKIARGAWDESVESFLPSVVVTSRQPLASRIRRRAHHGGKINERQESISFGGGKKRFLNDPVA
uniref:Sodium leak channel non-selective protein n=1 Tax=Taenia asiatica TaxID=60517 RepID=A0A0R3W3J0_TAEAS